MAQDIHPKLYEVLMHFGNTGVSSPVLSTKKRDIHLEADCTKTHKAWNPDSSASDNISKAGRASKYADLSDIF